MSAHAQLTITGAYGHPGEITVDEGLSTLLHLVWDREMTTLSSCQGGGADDDTAVAHIVFKEVADAMEFLIHSAYGTDFHTGDNLALTVQHPETDLGGRPTFKVSWLPDLTPVLTGAWAKSS